MTVTKVMGVFCNLPAKVALNEKKIAEFKESLKFTVPLAESHRYGNAALSEVGRKFNMRNINGIMHVRPKDVEGVRALITEQLTSGRHTYWPAIRDFEAALRVLDGEQIVKEF
jgi:hypothetical protein